MPDGSSIPLQSTESEPIVAPTSNTMQPTSMHLISNGFFSSYSSYTPPSAPHPTNEPPAFPSPSSTNTQNPPILNKNNKKIKKRSQPIKRKKSDVPVPDDVQTTTLKSIRNVLVETLAPSHLDEQLDQQLNAKLSQQLDQRTAGQDSPPHNQSGQNGQSGQSAVHHSARPDSIHSQSSQCSTSSSTTFSSRGLPPNENSSHSNAQSTVEDTPFASSMASIKSKPGRKAKNQPREDSKEKKARSLERNRVSLRMLCIAKIPDQFECRDNLNLKFGQFKGTFRTHLTNRNQTSFEPPRTLHSDAERNGRSGCPHWTERWKSSKSRTKICTQPTRKSWVRWTCSGRS